MRINIGLLIVIIVLSIIPAGVQGQSDEGLVAEWHFNEGSGSVVKDSSGNGNDGVIYGATWVEGKYGKALSFDGVDDYVNIPDSKEFHSTTFTIIAWIKSAKEDPQISWDRIASKKVNWNDDNGWSIELNSGGNIVVLGSGNFINVVNLLPSWDNEWHNLAISISGSNSEIFFDGIYRGTYTINSIVANNVPLSIGRLQAGSNYFGGFIDEVSIYNRPLSPKEVREYYEQGPNVLPIIKTASPQSIKQGQTTTITITVKNTGSTEIKDIEIADTIPQELTFINGETSKSYVSLSPKDSRQFQYVVQINEAGTYNLDPATATYADEKENYHMIKSKSARIEVIPSIIETANQKPTGSNALTASVHLHGEKTDVIIGEDILLKLAAVNLITKPTMHIQIIITPPSGMSVTSSEFVQSGAGLFTASYEIEPGVGRDIEVRMKSNQVGDFVVNGRIIYYFGDDMDNAEDHTLTLPITVRSEEEPTDSSSESKESSTPGFAGVGAVIGLLLAYMRKRI